MDHSRLHAFNAAPFRLCMAMEDSAQRSELAAFLLSYGGPPHNYYCHYPPPVRSILAEESLFPDEAAAAQAGHCYGAVGRAESWQRLLDCYRRHNRAAIEESLEGYLRRYAAESYLWLAPLLLFCDLGASARRQLIRGYQRLSRCYRLTDDLLDFDDDMRREQMNSARYFDRPLLSVAGAAQRQLLQLAEAEAARATRHFSRLGLSTTIEALDSYLDQVRSSTPAQ